MKSEKWIGDIVHSVDINTNKVTRASAKLLLSVMPNIAAMNVTLSQRII